MTISNSHCVASFLCTLYHEQISKHFLPEPEVLKTRPINVSAIRKNQIVSDEIDTFNFVQIVSNFRMAYCTDYGRPVRISSSLHGRKSTSTPKFLGTAEACFVCQIGQNYKISLIYAFIGCLQSVIWFMGHLSRSTCSVH